MVIVLEKKYNPRELNKLLRKMKSKKYLTPVVLPEMSNGMRIHLFTKSM